MTYLTGILIYLFALVAEGGDFDYKEITTIYIGSDCTADDGTPGVELWNICYSIENTTKFRNL